MQDLAGKIVLVTGAARGIGKAIALAFGAEKSRVVITGRTAAALEASRGNDTLHRRRSIGAPMRCDSKTAGGKPSAGDRKTFWRGEILVNNAGIAPAADFLEMADKLWDEVMRVNVNGAYNCCKTFLAPMIDAHWGRIINIASTVARVAYPGIAAYATSKHASPRPDTRVGHGNGQIRG